MEYPNHLNVFTAARDEAGRIVAVASVERYGTVGLLRSVAVAPDLQKSGPGSRLVMQVLQRAKETGVEEIVLLTTAHNLFARRLGFSETTRQHYDEILRDSSEWMLPRCAAATVVKLNLQEFKQNRENNESS